MPRQSRTPPVHVLHVLLHGREIGALTRLPDDRTVLTLGDEYVRDPERPTLSLSLKKPGGEVAVPGRPTHVKVPAFFSNLLPEGHLREYLAGKRGVKPEREFFLLWLLGEDLPGAVAVRPEGDAAMPKDAEGDAEHEPTEADVLRFSLAGLQLKFSAVMESAGGLTIPAHGVGGDWIVKLPSARFESVPENEFVMLALARAAGIDVPETMLVPVEKIARLPSGVAPGGVALAVRRFDRSGDGGRVHTEDFAQVFNLFPAEKYRTASCENLAAVLWAEAGQPDMAEFARRLAFTALIGNGDLHLKNWSLIYRDGRTPQLAPAYDFVSTVAYVADDRMALSLGGTKRWADVSTDLFRRFAAKARLPESLVVDAALETARRFRDAWEHHDVVGRLPDTLRARVAEHLRAVPLSGE